MEQAKSIFAMQEVMSRTPQDQGANALDAFLRKVKAVTSKSVKTREKSGELQNVFKCLSDRREISDRVCQYLEDFHICGSDSEGDAHNLDQELQDTRHRDQIERVRS